MNRSYFFGAFFAATFFAAAGLAGATAFFSAAAFTAPAAILFAVAALRLARVLVDFARVIPVFRGLRLLALLVVMVLGCVISRKLGPLIHHPTI